MFLALTWAATLGLLLSPEQQQGNPNDGSPIDDLLRNAIALRNGANAKHFPPTLSRDPPKYPCLKETPLQIVVEEGSWEGATQTRFRFNGTTYSLTEDDDWRKQVNFMLIGCPKCGTTSTYEFLVQHPRIIRPYEKETQCFFENWDESDPYCEHWYNVEWLRFEPTFITGDMTPEYLFRTTFVIPRTMEAFPWTKLVSILRDPVERAYSEYRMKLANGKTNETFQERIVVDLAAMRGDGLLPHWKFAEPAEDEQQMTFDDWKEASIDMGVFRKFHGSQEEMNAWIRHQSDASNGVLARGLYRVELSRWMMSFPCERFLVLRMEDYDQDDGVAITMERLHHHLGLEYVPLQDQTARNARNRESDIPPDIRLFLQRFFQPYNDLLYEILGVEWKHPWKYDDDA